MQTKTTLEMICINNSTYEKCLTVGKAYLVTIEGPNKENPMYSLKDDNGDFLQTMINRFEKNNEVPGIQEMAHWISYSIIEGSETYADAFENTFKWMSENYCEENNIIGRAATLAELVGENESEISLKQATEKEVKTWLSQEESSLNMEEIESFFSLLYGKEEEKEKIKIQVAYYKDLKINRGY